MRFVQVLNASIESSSLWVFTRCRVHGAVHIGLLLGCRRHGKVESASSLAPRPAGVPTEYVRTHQGFFHASCVVAIRDDEVWGTDLVIRGLDGTEHDTIPPCAYPRYSLAGRLIQTDITADERDSPQLAHSAGHLKSAKDTYDGWVVDYFSRGTLATGSNLTTEWIVPLLPANVATQDIAFFNDLETKTLILQPVLDFSEIPGKWAIESENCCASGNDVQSTLVPVSPGDRIRGVITTADCSAAGVCSNWTVSTTDLTTGQSTAITMQNPKEVANEVNPGALETYSVTSCDMFPANGEITFFDNALTAADGGVEQMTYDVETILSPSSYPVGFPANCGYRGSAAGNSYTLYFGTSPAPVGDAGAPSGDDGGGIGGGGSSSGGGATSSSSGAAGSSSGNPGTASSGGSSSGAISSSSSGSSGGSIDDAGSDSQSGSGSSSGMREGGAFGETFASSSGCSCNSANTSAGSPSLAFGVALLLSLRRRRKG